MARTYTKKTKMDTTTSFTDFLSLEEMEFFPNLDLCLPQYDDGLSDDVFQLPNKENDDDLLTGDILQELDFEGGKELLEPDWFTEKFDFSTFEPSALTDTTGTLQELDQVGSSICETKLPEISDELLIPLAEEGLQTIPEEIPATPEQKVPDYQAMSPYSTSSTVSPGLANSNPPSPYSSSSAGSPESTVTLIDLLSDEPKNKEAHSLESTPKRETPYSRPSSKQTPKPKVKTPAQKQRKRVQNKDAATRYRVKKRDEQDILFKEAEKVEKENDKLKEQVAAISKEIEYLKNLMVEVYKNKQKQQHKQANVISVT